MPNKNDPSFQDELDKLKGRINKAHEQQNPKPEEVPLDATRMSIEMVVGTLVGAFIGYHIDGWLGTMPLFFIVCLLLGLAAGVYNIYKAATQFDEASQKDVEE